MPPEHGPPYGAYEGSDGRYGENRRLAASTMQSGRGAGGVVLYAVIRDDGGEVRRYPTRKRAEARAAAEAKLHPSSRYRVRAVRVS